jgi:hypothetical protein
VSGGGELKVLLHLLDIVALTKITPRPNIGAPGKEGQISGEIKMKRVLLAGLVGCCALLTAVAMQGQAPPAPAPELQKLEFLTGHWAAAGTATMGAPGTPATKWSQTADVEWMDGKYFLVEHDDTDLGPMGKVKEMAVYGYDSDNKVYTYTSFDSMGQAEKSTGTVNGDTWVWTSDEHFGGQAFKGRYTLKVLSPTSYSMKFELSQDGTNWMTGMEGTATKK